MKKLSSSFLIISILLAGIFISCKKESSFNGNQPPGSVERGRRSGTGKNQPPVANAGPDATIILTTNTVTLDGSASTDPNNNISSYLWRKISGPSSFNIMNANAVRTQVTNLVQGIYQFELKVTDVRGLFDKDTVQITALQTGSDNSCGGNRQTVNANLVPFGTLSQGRFGIGAGAGAGKIVFAGGYTVGYTPSSRVDFFDISTQSWSTAELSVPRSAVCVAAVGNKIFFAGGSYYDPSDYENPLSVYVMDIYDVNTNAWSVVALPHDATYYQSAVVNNKIFFSISNSNAIDIYNLNTQSWSTTILSDGRFDFSMVAANNKVYFAGGSDFIGGNVIPLNRIDIYDNATNTWSVSSLAEAKFGTAGIAAAGKIFFAGGYNSNTNDPPFTTSCSVDIIDANTGAQSVQYLSRQWPDPGRMATMNNKIAFTPFHINYNGNEFDIYNIATNTWSKGILPVEQKDLISNSSILSGNNSIYIAGAYSSTSISNIVYKLEF